MTCARLLAATAAAVFAAAPSLRAETLAIIRGRIETAGPQGALPSGGVLIIDGRIVTVAKDLVPPPGARVIDAAGKVVTPGLIMASSDLMADEVEGVQSTREDMSRGKIGAAYDLALGLNPDSTFVPLARQGGVTRALVTPTSSRGYGDEEEALVQETAGGGETLPPASSLFAGQAAAVSLAAGQTDPVFKRKAAMVVDLGDAGARFAGSHAGGFIFFKGALEEARTYGRQTSAYERGASRPFVLSREDLEALQSVLRGETPLLIRVHQASDIRQVLKIAADEKIRVMLEGAEEGWLVADALAAAKVPVVIDPEADLPQQFESLGARLDNAARLEKAGVLVAILGSRSVGNYRQERFNAGTAVANGLPYEAALRAVTLNSAKILGASDRLGPLEPGKIADLVIWSGDPFETSSFPETVLIAGVVQPDRSREFELRDRYAHADDGLPSAYH